MGPGIGTLNQDSKVDLTGLPDQEPEVDLTGLPDQDPVAPTSDYEIDLAGLPDQDEFSPSDIVGQAVRNIPVPPLGGIRLGQIQDLSKADQDFQKLIKATAKYPYELFTGQITPEQMQDVDDTDFKTMLEGAFPGAAQSPSTITQFALNINAEILEWGTRPSAWVALGAMRTYNKPLAKAIGEGMRGRFPKTHAFWTKQRGTMARIEAKLASGETLTPKETEVFNESVSKTHKIFSQEALRERTETALGQKIRSGEVSRAQARVDRGTEMKLLPAPGESVVNTPLSNNPVRVFDSRVSGPTELSNLVLDSTGKPLTIGPGELGVVVESAVKGVETIVVAAEPEIVTALKTITEKINDYVVQGRRAPDSLLKRQKAVLGAIEVPGEAGKNIPVDKIIGTIPSEKIVSTEKQLLRDKFRNLARGYREGKTTAMSQMKENVALLKQTIKESDLVDKTKLLTQLTDIAKLAKPTADFKAIVLDVQAKIAKLELAQENKVLDGLIRKELKRTKSVKKGAKRVAKYDYETNKFLDELRRIAGLTKESAQAELDAMPTIDLSKADIIKTRLLSYKANGAASSAELRTNVLEDIKRMKALGRKAKNEADFKKQLERKEAVEEFEKAINKIKATADTATNWFLTKYTQGISNIGSAIHSVAGGEMSRKYDPEIKQLDMVTDIYETETIMIDGAVEQLGVKNRWEFRQKLTEMENAKIEVVDVRGKAETLNKMQLIDIYNAIKHPLFKARYEGLYGAEQLDTIIYENLNPAERAFGDYIMESLKDYYAVYNEHNIAMTGRDLPQRDPYWPGTSESTADIFDEMRRAGETPSAEKMLSKSSKIEPKATNAWNKALYHMKTGEHVRHLSPAYEKLKNLIADRDIRLAITRKFGKTIYENIKKKVEIISLANYGQSLDAIGGVMNQAVSNWTGAKVSLPNVTSPIRQLVSVINFAEKMPVGEWASGFGDSVADGKATWDYMWEKAPWLGARFKKGYAENIARAIKDTMRVPGTDMSWAEAGSILTRLGDVGAIVYGGCPYVKWLQTSAGGGMTEAEAFEEFKWSIKSQQSPLSSGLSDFQNSRHWGNRMLFNFKNTVSQYLRKSVDSVVSYINGEIPKKQMIKTLFIYWIANPILFALLGEAVTEGVKGAGELVRGEELSVDAGEFAQDVMLQIAISSSTAIPILEHIVNFAARWAIKQKKPQQIFSMGVLDDIEFAVTGLAKANPNFTDYIKALGTGVEVGAGIGVLSGLRYWELFQGTRGNKGGKKTLADLKYGR